MSQTGLKPLTPRDKPSRFEVSDIELYRSSTVGDGNCFLHAVMGCYLNNYQKLAWDKAGKPISRNMGKLSVLAKELRDDICDTFFFGELLSSNLAKEYMRRLFGTSDKEYIYNGKTNAERHLDRIFQIPIVLGKYHMNDDNLPEDWEEPLGLKKRNNEFWYVRYKLDDGSYFGYKLVNYVEGNQFDHHSNLSAEDKQSIRDEFLALDFLSPVNIFSQFLSLQAVIDMETAGLVENVEDSLAYPTFSSPSYVSQQCQLLVQFSNSLITCQEIFEFFVGSDYFTEAYIKIAALTLNLNIVVIDRYLRKPKQGEGQIFVYNAQESTRPWIITVLVGELDSGHYEMVGEKSFDGKLKTIFDFEDSLIQTLIVDAGLELPESLIDTLLHFNLEEDFAADVERARNYPMTDEVEEEEDSDDELPNLPKRQEISLPKMG